MYEDPGRTGEKGVIVGRQGLLGGCELTTTIMAMDWAHRERGDSKVWQTQASLTFCTQ